MTLDTHLRLRDPDQVYEHLIAAHRDLSFADSAALNAKLVLILANHIGDVGIVEEALALAAKSGPAEETGTGAEILKSH